MASGRGCLAADVFCGLSGSSAGEGAGGRPLGPWQRGNRVRAGQAAVAGGPQAASNRFIHPVSRCQPSGRCMVMWPRPWRAMRAATAISWPRMVEPRAFAPDPPARQPAARVRLWQMAARVSHAAFAGKCPDGRCVEGLAVSGLRKLCLLKPLPAIPGTHCGPLAEAGTRSPSGDAFDCSAVRCSVQYHAWPFRGSDRLCDTRAPS